MILTIGTKNVNETVLFKGTQRMKFVEIELCTYSNETLTKYLYNFVTNETKGGILFKCLSTLEAILEEETRVE